MKLLRECAEASGTGLTQKPPDRDACPWSDPSHRGADPAILLLGELTEQLTVRACPETVGCCPYLADEHVSVPARDEQKFIYRWNGLGSLGEVEVTAEIESVEDPEPTNEREVAHHYVVAGGTGFGVGF